MISRKDYYSLGSHHLCLALRQIVCICVSMSLPSVVLMFNVLGPSVTTLKHASCAALVTTPCIVFSSRPGVWLHHAGPVCSCHLFASMSTSDHIPPHCICNHVPILVPSHFTILYLFLFSLLFSNSNSDLLLSIHAINILSAFALSFSSDCVLN